jgi:hypothetical protein
MSYCVQDVLQALDDLTGGRCITGTESCANEKGLYVITKSSDIRGKAVTEMPGLVWGNLDMPVARIAVVMTLTENAIELAAATGVNVIIVHHPIADAASTGGVLLKYYLDLYSITVFELHEAFHGLHPGIPFLHGHKPFYINVNYGGIKGNIVYVGDILPELNTIGCIVDRLNIFMDIETEKRMLSSERVVRDCTSIQETIIAACCKILLGDRKSQVSKVIHMFPHSGFNANHLENLIQANPDVDMLLASISQVFPSNEIVAKAKEYGLTFLCGNSHALELQENGLPLAYAIRKYLPMADIVIFRERVTSTPLDNFGSGIIQDYAREMASCYL